MGGGGCDFTSCLADCSHVPSMGVSLSGGPRPGWGSLSRVGGLNPGWLLCPGWGSPSRGLCPEGFLSRGSLSIRMSVQGGVSVQGVSIQGNLCPGWGSVSRVGVSVQDGGLCSGWGSLSIVEVSI